RRSARFTVFKAVGIRARSSTAADRQGPKRRQKMSFALNVIARGSIVLAAAAVACIPLRRASAAARHAGLVLAIASMLLLPLAVALVPQLHLPVLPQASDTTQLTPATIYLSTIATGRRLEGSTGYFMSEFLLVLWTFGLTVMLTRFLAGTL